MVSLRGDVWDVDLGPDTGPHPAVVLSTTAPDMQSGHVAVAVITGTGGPPSTHVTLTPDAGLTGYEECYADITTLQPVDRYDLLRQRGRLTLPELTHVEDRLRVHLGL